MKLTTAEWAKIDKPRKVPACGLLQYDNVYSIEEDDALGKTVGEVLASKHHSGNKVCVRMLFCMCPGITNICPHLGFEYVLILLSVCPHGVRSCVRIFVCMCPHVGLYVVRSHVPRRKERDIHDTEKQIASGNKTRAGSARG